MIWGRPFAIRFKQPSEGIERHFSSRTEHGKGALAKGTCTAVNAGEIRDVSGRSGHAQGEYDEGSLKQTVKGPDLHMNQECRTLSWEKWKANQGVLLWWVILLSWFCKVKSFHNASTELWPPMKVIAVMKSFRDCCLLGHRVQFYSDALGSSPPLLIV